MMRVGGLHPGLAENREYARYGREQQMSTTKQMPTGSLAKLHTRAAVLGWQCLSETWRGHQTSYEFECSRGHHFERHATTVLYQNPACPGCEAEAIRERWMMTLAARGGELVEGVFTGLQARNRLRCDVWTGDIGNRCAGTWVTPCQSIIAAQSG